MYTLFSLLCFINRRTLTPVVIVICSACPTPSKSYLILPLGAGIHEETYKQTWLFVVWDLKLQGCFDVSVKTILMTEEFIRHKANSMCAYQ